MQWIVQQKVQNRTHTLETSFVSGTVQLFSELLFVCYKWQNKSNPEWYEAWFNSERYLRRQSFIKINWYKKFEWRLIWSKWSTILIWILSASSLQNICSSHKAETTSTQTGCSCKYDMKGSWSTTAYNGQNYEDLKDISATNFKT